MRTFAGWHDVKYKNARKKTKNAGEKKEDIKVRKKDIGQSTKYRNYRGILNVLIQEKTLQVRENLSQQLEGKQVPKMTELGFWKDKCSLLACHIHCICSMETTRNFHNKQAWYQSHIIGEKEAACHTCIIILINNLYGSVVVCW